MKNISSTVLYMIILQYLFKSMGWGRGGGGGGMGVIKTDEYDENKAQVHRVS